LLEESIKALQLHYVFISDLALIAKPNIDVKLALLAKEMDAAIIGLGH